MVGHQRLTDLCEADLVLRTDQLLAGLREQVVHDVLEAFLLHRQLLGRIRIPLLQLGDDTVADVHLIVEEFPLQMVQLEVEERETSTYGSQSRERLTHIVLTFREGLGDVRVQRADHVVADPFRILRHHFEFHPLQHVRGKLPAGGETLHHLVQDRTLTLAVTAAEDVHLSVQLPHHVLLSAPERVDLDLLDIIRVLCHRPLSFFDIVYLNVFGLLSPGCQKS